MYSPESRGHFFLRSSAMLGSRTWKGIPRQCLDHAPFEVPDLKRMIMGEIWLKIMAMHAQINIKLVYIWSAVSKRKQARASGSKRDQAWCSEISKKISEASKKTSETPKKTSETSTKREQTWTIHFDVSAYHMIFWNFDYWGFIDIILIYSVRYFPAFSAKYLFRSSRLGPCFLRLYILFEIIFNNLFLL